MAGESVEFQHRTIRAWQVWHECLVCKTGFFRKSLVCRQDTFSCISQDIGYPSIWHRLPGIRLSGIHLSGIHLSSTRVFYHAL